MGQYSVPLPPLFCIFYFSSPTLAEASQPKPKLYFAKYTLN